MKALFLGDSITEGFDLEKHFPGREFTQDGLHLNQETYSIWKELIEVLL
jgi:lysophospholipase L1-like esterase